MNVRDEVLARGAMMLDLLGHWDSRARKRLNPRINQLAQELRAIDEHVERQQSRGKRR